MRDTQAVSYDKSNFILITSIHLSTEVPQCAGMIDRDKGIKGVGELRVVLS